MTPTATLDSRFSSPEAQAVDWERALERLAGAEVAWIVTVRRDGRPHSTPVVPVCVGSRVFFHTGPTEQKHVNLQGNDHVLVLVGDTAWDSGVDVAVEGVAHPVSDHDELSAVAAAFAERWDGRWQLKPGDGGFVSDDGISSRVFEVRPAKAFAFTKGDPFGHTTYRF